MAHWVGKSLPAVVIDNYLIALLAGMLNVIWFAWQWLYSVLLTMSIVFDMVQAMAAGASAEVPAVSGRTVHRGPAVRPGSGEPEQQVQLYKHTQTGLIGSSGYPLFFLIH